MYLIYMCIIHDMIVHKYIIYIIIIIHTYMYYTYTHIIRMIYNYKYAQYIYIHIVYINIWTHFSSTSIWFNSYWATPLRKSEAVLEPVPGADDSLGVEGETGRSHLAPGVHAHHPIINSLGRRRTIFSVDVFFSTIPACCVFLSDSCFEVPFSPLVEQQRGHPQVLMGIGFAPESMEIAGGPGEGS